MIYLEDVSYNYPNGRMGVKNIHFHLKPKSFTYIHGHSGAGKSTLIRLIMAIMMPQSGQIIVNKQNINRLGLQEIPYYRRKIGTVFQDNQLLFEKNVFENVALPLVIQGYDKENIDKRVEVVLKRVSVWHLRDELPNNISIGEQQRVSIARAVVSSPQILIADEPTGNLDEQLARSIMRLFYDFCATAGSTVVIATHQSNFKDPSLLNVQKIELQKGMIVNTTQTTGGAL